MIREKSELNLSRSASWRSSVGIQTALFPDFFDFYSLIYNYYSEMLAVKKDFSLESSQANKFVARLCEWAGMVRNERSEWESERAMSVSKLAGWANGSENLFAWVDGDKKDLKYFYTLRYFLIAIVEEMTPKTIPKRIW